METSLAVLHKVAFQMLQVVLQGKDQDRQDRWGIHLVDRSDLGTGHQDHQGRQREGSLLEETDQVEEN